MGKSEPTVQKYMTCQPHSVEEATSVADVQKLMSGLSIRHLPVLRDGKIVGIVSDRDVKNALGLLGASPEKLIVRNIEHESPYQVSPDALLHQVTGEMAEHHYGCAIVVQNGKLVGIFTTVDACRALSDILQQRHHNR
jgi:acetoin utilization protein AcuB